MGVDHCPGDRQAESKTSETARDGRLSLLKGVEDLADFLGFDTDAGVDDPCLDFLRRWIRRFQDDRSAGGSEFDAVLYQVPKNLLQSRRIAFDIRLLGVQTELDPNLFLVDILATNFVGALNGFVD